eukprot:Protomagalhaensia_wolfi_Nauph_80__689@NODE_1394_length_1546_cov_753_351029_g1079_i0_p1_GENE_NODE_1394_length_1546_cov_753_351029_g1079_i0NODE_1394_length_1546_cov_753_351029_g1079_i0_p1_ORF_typecomplete_len213_score27_05LysR_substrate/PF03466_20/0_21LysR_substrate/PF03466_20/91ORC5_C/PF14630_6/0_3Sm_multidrug_ex/PF06695_11/54Sm_multidrug_ex/PF06695_11/5_4_NODE_1394_length_1546_cov_753_351029_g1079_i0275913
MSVLVESEESGTPCLLLSAAVTTLLLGAHIITPSRTLSMTTNLVCLAICISCAAVCCLPARLWRSRLVRLLLVRPTPIWLTLSNMAILVLALLSLRSSFEAPSATNFNNPLARVIAQSSTATYHDLCRYTLLLLTAAWAASTAALLTALRTGFFLTQPAVLRLGAAISKGLLDPEEEDEGGVPYDHLFNNEDYANDDDDDAGPSYFSRGELV